MDTTAQLPQVYIVIENQNEAREDISSNFTPKKNLAMGGTSGGRISGKKNLILADLFLRGGRQFVHVSGRKVHHVRLKDGDAVRSDGVPPYLDQQGLQCLG